jgi:hypothetical protein
MLPDFRNGTALEGFQPSTVCPSGKSNTQMQIAVQHWLNEIDRKTEILGEKPCLSATSSTTNLTRTDRGSKLGLRGERPAIA